MKPLRPAPPERIERKIEKLVKRELFHQRKEREAAAEKKAILRKYYQGAVIKQVKTDAWGN